MGQNVGHGDQNIANSLVWLKSSDCGFGYSCFVLYTASTAEVPTRNIHLSSVLYSQHINSFKSF